MSELAQTSLPYPPGDKYGELFFFEQSSKDDFNLHGFGSTSVVYSVVVELCQTNLATEEGKLEHRPDVLVVSDSIVNFMAEGFAPWRKTAKHYNVNSRAYGKDYSLGGEKMLATDEKSLLEDLVFVEGLGSAFLELPSSVTKEHFIHITRMARRYFDIILVVGNSFKHLENMEAYGQQYELRKARILDTTNTLRKLNENTIVCSPNPKILLAIPDKLRMYVPQKSKGLSDYTMRLMARDIARHILDIPLKGNQELGNSKQLPKPPNARNRLGVAVSGTFTSTSAFITSVFMMVEELTFNQLLGSSDGLLALSTAALSGIIASVMTGHMAAVSGVELQDDKLKQLLGDIVNEVELPTAQYRKYATSSNSLEAAIAHTITPSQESEHQDKIDPGDVFLLPLEVVQKRHWEIQQAWLEYEINPVKLLEVPLMTDPSCKQTQQFYAAMTKAEQWEEVVLQEPYYLHEYEKAVDALDKAFMIAESHARKMSLSYFNDKERKKIKEAAPFVQVAQNEASSPTERIGAWKRANDILEGVLALPEASVVGLLEGAGKAA